MDRETADALDVVPVTPPSPPGGGEELFEPLMLRKTPQEEHRDYPSLYDNLSTTFSAIVIGLVIILGVQFVVYKIFAKPVSEHKVLTQFVAFMVALILGIYTADMLIAGPDTELLSSQERVQILNFIMDTCLMVFAYYFGTKADVPKEPPPSA